MKNKKIKENLCFKAYFEVLSELKKKNEKMLTLLFTCKELLTFQKLKLHHFPSVPTQINNKTLKPDLAILSSTQ